MIKLRDVPCWGRHRTPGRTTQAKRMMKVGSLFWLQVPVDESSEHGTAVHPCRCLPGPFNVAQWVHGKRGAPNWTLMRRPGLLGAASIYSTQISQRVMSSCTPLLSVTLLSFVCAPPVCPCSSVNCCQVP